VIKNIKVMLLPNNKQQTKMFQTADAARYAYNWTVATQMEHFKQNGKYMSELDIRKLFTQHKQEKLWLYEVSNDASKQAIRDCCDAFWRFCKEKKKPNYKPYSKKQIIKASKNNSPLTRYNMHCHPKFKKKGKNIPKFYMDTGKIEFSDTHVKLEKIANGKKKNRAKANWIKLAERARIPTDIKYTNPRISYDGIHWWISVGIEEESNQFAEFAEYGEGEGIDVGIKELAICSNENRYKNINKTKTVCKLKKKQRRLQRKVSRKYLINKEGESYKKTSNIIKSKKQLLKINQRLTGIRHNHIHQITSEIIKQKPSFLVLEDLNVRGMMKNKHLAKALQEQCLYEFSRQIQYKCGCNGIKFIEADRYYPSSKTCCMCGNIKKDLKLSDRTYICNECGNVIDRDYQAALNLKRYGEAIA